MKINRINEFPIKIKRLGIPTLYTTLLRSAGDKDFTASHVDQNKINIFYHHNTVQNKLLCTNA